MHISLIPFGSQDSCKIVSQVHLNENQNVKLHFEIADYNPSIELQQSDQILHSKDKLYTGTCFELFIGRGPAYVEWNISPKGHWYGYAFSSYRTLREYDLSDFTPTAISLKLGPNVLTLDVELPWSPLGKYIPSGGPLMLKPCVILEKEGDLQFWAPEHAGEKPDFHDSLTFKNHVTK